MSHTALREQVLEANLSLPRHGLVTFTWGNVSGFDPDLGLVAIKPSGVAYEAMRLDDIVVLDLDGRVVEGRLKPSSDTPTHLLLYRHWPQLRGVVHTHSTHASSWAQALQPIPAFGTTHADYFHGEIACTRPLTQAEVEGAYELNTGHVIVETFGAADPLARPGVLVAEHAPFAWGTSPEQAVHNAVVMEEVARMALYTLMLDPRRRAIAPHLLDKHYLRKHGRNAYYGQSSGQ
jgi:L-ribulose-5-phosphate 4-epimerase